MSSSEEEKKPKKRQRKQESDDEGDKEFDVCRTRILTIGDGQGNIFASIFAIFIAQGGTRTQSSRFLSYIPH